ncbi:MAG: ATP-binding cassette domain-containing protein [Actinomycetota bacterium]
MEPLLGLTLRTDIVLIGLFTGLAYAVLAAGLVLVFRATRVINFAYGETGALGAAIVPVLVFNYGWPYALALPAVVALGAIVGGVIELGVVRRLFHAPRLVLLVATIGVAQLLFFLQLILPDITSATRYPVPINRAVEVGGMVWRGEHFMVLAFVPAIIAGLTIFLTRTPYGIAIRASAENADSARLAGISVKRISTLVWVLAGVLSTLTAVLVRGMQGSLVSLPTVAVGPSLLLRALTAALVARLTSLPTALAAGVGIGIVEALLFANVGNPGTIDLVLFGAVLFLVLVRGRGIAEEETGSWSLSPKVKAIPHAIRSAGWVRRLPLAAGGALVVVAVVLPLLVNASQTFLMSRMLIYAMIGLAITVLTGWAGQVSLGHFAFVGIGALGTAAFVRHGVPFGVAVVYSAAAGVLAAVLIGTPALRIRGLLLAVTTLGFSVAARAWIFGQDLFLAGGTVVTVPRPTWGSLDFFPQRSYYYLCLVALIGAVLVVTRIRRSGVGRSLIAVRENEASAAAFTVSAARAKLTAFAVSGGLAALAGALLAGLTVQFGAEMFDPDESLRVVAMTIIGGLGSVTGAVLGAVYVIGVPAIFNNAPEARLLSSGVGMLILLLYFPGGLVGLVYRARDALLGFAGRRARPVEPAVVKTAPVPASVLVAPSANGGTADEPATPGSPADVPPPALRVQDVTVRFGGRIALDHATLEVFSGELIGLIGSNGAGKTTIMNVISGFVAPAGGRVELSGLDVTHLRSHRRAQLGLGRLFQDARLFGALTVRESVQVALEAREHSELVPSMLALPPSLRAERRKASEAEDLVGFLGLGRFADMFISDLSTGTRRIAELACLLALEARVLLLDEPTAGVAQREAEAFGPLIRRIQTELGATVLMIEHDIPLVMSISDRVYCLGAGRVIASGRPAAVRSDPEVIASYLGTDDRAILRSGAR